MDLDVTCLPYNKAVLAVIEAEKAKGRQVVLATASHISYARRIAEHLQIFDALVRRDGNLAQALMSSHLQGVESYWKGLIGSGAPAEPERVPADA